MIENRGCGPTELSPYPKPEFKNRWSQPDHSLYIDKLVTYQGTTYGIEISALYLHPEETHVRHLLWVKKDLYWQNVFCLSRTERLPLPKTLKDFQDQALTLIKKYQESLIAPTLKNLLDGWDGVIE